jgi:2-polyprenyl-3-methyl-5-hydroxy-6-metoxy-1,4-benzoquinol methylase
VPKQVKYEHSELGTRNSVLKGSYEQHDSIVLALESRPRVPPAQASNFLPLTAALYEPLWRKRSLSIITLGEFNVDRELELMLEWLNLQPNQVILDAACSAGLYARTLLNYDSSLTVHAVDFSLPFLKKAKLYAERDKLFPIFVQADVSDLPYENQVFDSIVCGGSLNEFLDVPNVMKEFARVLKPGGKMWQMYLKRSEEPFGKTLQGLLRLSGIRFIAPRIFEQQCNEVGLNLIKAQHRGRVVMALFEKVVSSQ